MSPDILERATPERVTEWTIDRLQRHLAGTCSCPWGDPCKGFELTGYLTGEYVRDFRQAEGVGDE